MMLTVGIGAGLTKVPHQLLCLSGSTLSKEIRSVQRAMRCGFERFGELMVVNEIEGNINSLHDVLLYLIQSVRRETS